MIRALDRAGGGWARRRRCLATTAAQRKADEMEMRLLEMNPTAASWTDEEMEWEEMRLRSGMR
jgi:hypothetical protein